MIPPASEKGLAMWQSLQYSGWVTLVSDTAWLYAAVSILHYFTLFIFVGTTAILDLRVLGIADRNHTISQVAEQVLPWNWIVLALALLSGFVLFATDATDYLPVGLFWAKISVILLAILVTVVLQRGLRSWDKAQSAPGFAKVVALLSLLLWIGAILIAVDISYISGVG
jgi:hypothetical protein